MRTPEDVAAMLRLHELGWGSKRIAKELGVSRNTVRRYLRQGGYAPYKAPKRSSTLDGLGDWLRERFLVHRGNADVVRQELLKEKMIDVSLRTVERAVQPFRRELRAQAKATVRFETAPGEQMQIDFGSTKARVGGEWVRLFLFVATLGFSRRTFACAFSHERQASWFDGLERAFAHFGGVTHDVLIDNARALVSQHDAVTREVVFNARFHAFAKHWGFRPVACAPYRARTKGKDERAVGYVKRNAIAGHEFLSWSSVDARLVQWAREVADVRIHGTTGERPIDRFERELDALTPLASKPSFVGVREFQRVVHNDLSVQLATNAYSVPWRLIGAEVTVRIHDGRVEIFHAGERVASHRESRGRRERVVDPAHFDGVVRVATETEVATDDELVRSLDVYESLVKEVS